MSHRQTTPPFILLLLALPAAAQLPRTEPHAPLSEGARRTPLVAAVERIGPAVVNISAERIVRQRADPLEEFFLWGSPDRRERGYRAESLGSGVVIDPSGIVITNDHVVQGASRIVVTTADGKAYEAKVEGADADNDLAVLTVKAKGLTAAKLGTTADLMIGETVVAVGNPFGLSSSVTAGIVSAVRRTVRGETGRTYTDFIQTDAAINPGNSGGALANILGELIGINTAIVGGANTIGFAIPVERARRIADELLRFGEVKPVWVGLRGETITEDDRLSSRGRGFRIRSVWPNSPAEKAGFALDDVIVAVDGWRVESREDFETAIVSAGPGNVAGRYLPTRGRRADDDAHDVSSPSGPRAHAPPSRDRPLRSRGSARSRRHLRRPGLPRRPEGDRTRRPPLQREQREDRLAGRPEPDPRDQLRTPGHRHGGRPGRLRLHADVCAGLTFRGGRRQDPARGYFRDKGNSETRIPKRTSMPPQSSRPESRSPRNTALRSAANTGSSA